MMANWIKHSLAAREAQDSIPSVELENSDYFSPYGVECGKKEPDTIVGTLWRSQWVIPNHAISVLNETNQ